MPKEEQEMEEIQIELDEDETEEAEKKEKKSSEPEDDEEESDDLEDSDSAGEDKKAPEEKTESSEDREAIRERRRREKKMKRERERRDRMIKDNIIASLQKEVQQLKEVAGHFSKEFGQVKQKTIESEKKELSDLYNQASKVMEVAIAEGDGKKFSEAQRIRDGVLAKYNAIENSRVEREVPEKEEPTEEVKQSQPDIVGEEGKRYGIAWVKKNSSWYDPNGNNRDSKIVQTIDTDLYNEGYDPNTKEYWDELTDRCKEYLPHRFKAQTQKSSPQIVGGSGRDSSSASYKSLTVPKEFLQSLKAAGYEPGDAKYKAAVKNYYAQKKGA